MRVVTRKAPSFQERFRRAREGMGLTKTAVATPRYSLSYVSQIESGKRRPSPEALAFFAQKLRVSEAYLLTGVPDALNEELAFHLEESRILISTDDLDRADERLADVLLRSTEYGLTGVHALALVLAGHVRVRRGRVREAIDRFEEAIEAGLPERELGLTTAALARAYAGIGDLAYAVDLVESYLRTRGPVPMDPSVMAELQTVLVSTYFERGDVVRAERVAKKALEGLDHRAAPHVRANVFWVASRVLAEAKRWDEALDLATRARVLLEETGDRWRIAGVHNAYAFLCLESDPPRIREAAEHLDATAKLLGPGASAEQLAYLHAERGRLALMEDRPEDALRSSEQALELVDADTLERGRCLYLRGRALTKLDRRDEALDSFHEAAAAFSKSGSRQQEASCWREIGDLELASGNVYEAVDALRWGLTALDPSRSRA